jgi:peptidoglycan hydrolase CwlO-like protein
MSTTNAKANPEYVIYSLQNQLAEANLKIAERDAVITEYFQKIKDLESEIDELRNEKIKQLDAESGE